VRLPVKQLFSASLLAIALACGAQAAPLTVDRLGISDSAAENREFSYTDKQAGYFYGRTHGDDNTAYFAGWNVSTKRIFQDYALSVDGASLRRVTAKVTTYPDRLERDYGAAKERLMLFDREPVVGIELSGVQGRAISITLRDALVQADGVDEHGLWLRPREAPDAVLLVAPWNKAAVTVLGSILTASADAGGFVIVYGADRKDGLAKLGRFRAEHGQWIAARRDRMNALVARTVPETDQPDLDKALAWVTLTGDSLVMRQMGSGIYAGLPWFNDYWGRDTFISLPGLLLTTGQFAAAKDVLRSFAALQDTDPNSRTFGRVPNRARPGDLIYNTADGTPRFVIALEEYARYTGDTALIAELYPAVKRAAAGALRYWVDPSGYLTHDDADTWMDARWQGKDALSPRGNRANDIEGLWYGQMRASAEMARMAGDPSDAGRWTAIAEKVAAHFKQDYFGKGHNDMADRLASDGTPDFRMRPNQLFALDLVDDAALKMRLTREAWERLVYPWGVASLDQDDPSFYPYHENWHYYHKDRAYHNGTVWPWLNGIAMQRMLEQDQPDIAWRLFANMNDQVLRTGAVGSLSELADALPRDGASRAKPSGAFLQAWSNAEQLRIWQQGFLGVKPDLLRHRVDIRPEIPSALNRVSTRIAIGAGSLHYEFKRMDNTYTFRLTGLSPSVWFALPDYPAVRLPLAPENVVAVAVSAAALKITATDRNGKITSQTVAASPQQRSAHDARNAFFSGTDFQTPRLAPNLKSLRTYQAEPIAP
jgi:glycogen debranching enzyme